MMGVFTLGGVWDYCSSRLGETYNYLTDGEVSFGEHYDILRHSRPFIIYSGVKTQVPITIFGDHHLPSERRVFLQRRGYRTALSGWTIGGLLGGAKLPGIEVTPANEEPFDSLSSYRRSHFHDDISRLYSPSKAISYKPLETMLVHIPVSSGDGYFRLRITAGNSSKTLAISPVFRVGSISWASAHPQGASLFGLVPEMAIKTSFIAAKTTAYASFYTAFPFLKIAEWTPGPWREYAVRLLYSHALSEEQRGSISDSIVKGKERLHQANDSIYRKVPFGAVGVRTLQDLKKDEEIGRGGVWYNWENHFNESMQ